MGRCHRGNGTRILLLTDRQGTPLAAYTTAAHHSEVNTIETLVEERSASVPALTGVLDTWPDYRDHMLWVRLGSTGWSAFSDTYGATDKPVGGGMPAHAALDDQDLALIVLYERVQFGELEETDEEYELLLAIAEGETTFADAGLGDVATAAGIPEDQLQAG